MPIGTNKFIQIATSSERYRAVLRKYGRVRKNLTHPEIVTRTARQANFKMVASETRGGARRAKLGKPPLSKAMSPEKTRKRWKKEHRLFFALASRAGHRKGKNGNELMRPAATRIYNRRRSGKGAMVAGFLVSARRLGLKKKGSKGAQPDPSVGLSASRSRGEKARRRLAAFSVNMVKGAYEAQRKLMDRAIRAVIRDMDDWANKEIDKVNKKAERGQL